VDVLRALAALAVLYHHVPFSAADLPPLAQALLSAPTRLGRLGVPLFLVLSGFCIHLSVARGLARGEGVRPTWGAFWRRRFWRLYPPYLAAIALSLAIYRGLAGPQAYPDFERVVALPWDLLTHLVMAHNLFADYCFGLGNGPFWSLGLEEQLYALYALFLVLRRRRSSWWIAGVTLLVCLAWQGAWKCGCGMDDGAVQPAWGPAPLALGRWLKWPVGLWFYWVLGAVAAEAHTGALRLPAWCSRRRAALLFVAFGLGTSSVALGTLFPAGDQASHSGVSPEPIVRLLSGCSEPAFAVAAFILLNRWVRAEVEGRFRGPLVRALAAVGLMSYSLYLTHLPLVRLLVHLLPPGTSLAAWLLRLAVVLPTCVGFAALFFRLVEQHFLGQPRARAGPPFPPGAVAALHAPPRAPVPRAPAPCPVQAPRPAAAPAPAA
jgi:peptidoglycan/LPS O-acetylase OafA/YrhL